MIKRTSIALALLALGTAAHAQTTGGAVSGATQDQATGKTASVSGTSAADASSGTNVTANAAVSHGSSLYAETYNQAVADYNAGNFNAAAGELRSVAKKNRNDVNINLMLSSIYLRQKNYADALPLLETIAKQSPKDVVNRDNLGEVYLQQNRPADAAVQFKAVLARAPKDEAATQGLALALSQTGNSGDAIATLQKLAASSPSVSSYENLAAALQKSGRAMEAAQAFQKAAVLAPTNPDLPFYAGETYVQAGSNDKAVPMLTQALALKTQYQFPTHIMLAQIYSTNGARDKAIAEYKAATLVQPADPMPWFNLGVLQQQAGQTDDAKQDFAKVVSLKPADMGMLKQAQQSLAALQATPGK